MEIFLSYSWKENEVADIICNMFEGLKNPNVQIFRDKERLQFMQNIKLFMKSIKDKDYVILVISDSYLKSYNCMYEINEIVKDENYKKKILVLVSKKINIFNAKGINEYLKFWQNKSQELSNELPELDLVNQKATIDELRKTNEISLSMSDFLQSIGNLKIIQYDDNITLNDFDEIKNYLGLGCDKFRAIPNSYCIINVPRTVCRRNKLDGNTIIWWANDNKSYTNDLRDARIFTLEDAKKLINGSNNWGCKKFAAIPTDVVVSFKQNIIPNSHPFNEMLCGQQSRILGNSRLYLNDHDISLLI